MMRLLRRSWLGSGRWIRPSRFSSVLVAALIASVVASAAWTYRWATRTASPAGTLAMAGTVLRGTLDLDSALAVTWAWSVGGSETLEDRWLNLVAPRLPPGICTSPAGPEGGVDTSDLDVALRQLDQAVVSGAQRAELERRILALREAGSVPPGSRSDFIVRYNLGRAYAAAGDWGTAAELVDPLLEGWISPDRVPETRRDLVGRQVARGSVGEPLALEAIHGRYLAGTIAFHRGEARMAVIQFRRAINAVHYLLALRGRDELAPEGHYQRIPASLGDSRCAGTQVDDVLTSLDAYAGLVASYMSDDEFSDRAGLAREVARTRLEIDPRDPFRPVLAHASLSRGDPDLTSVPEHLLWAASNLQRVYHYNRLRPDPRLEVTRAVLLLHLTSRPEWVEDFRRRGGAEVCTMLGGLGQDLQRDAAAMEVARATYQPADSARAAVAVQTFARLDRDCPDSETIPMGPEVQSTWIRLGGTYLTRGLGGMYEGMRTEIAEALRNGSDAPAVVLEERIAPIIERARSHRRDLHRGRVPGELPADLPVEPVRRFVDEWWSAVFGDVARALIDDVRGRPASLAPQIRASQVPALLAALESSVTHAEMTSADLYTSAELVPLASTQGRGSVLAWEVRNRARARPWVTAGVLAAMAVAAGVLILVVHVNWWRYRILTGPRLYLKELARHRAPLGGTG